MSKRLIPCLAAMAAPIACAYASAETVLYSFTAPPNGVRPQANVVSDAAGNLYGTTYTGAANGTGTVYELSPPVAGQTQWTEKVLHHFGSQSHGHYPQSAVTLDSAGNIYGVTPNGSANDAGVVFMLTKPASGSGEWQETVLYHFNGRKNGGTPYGGVVFGKDGSLYGTTGYGGTSSAGTVFKLTLTAGTWTESVLYSFANGADGGYPYSIPLFDAAGNIYGTTLNGGNTGNGVVFELSPPKSGGVWTEQVLHSFDASTDGVMPRIGVTMDSAGNLYGTTETGGAYGWGVVYEVSPPVGGGTSWTESVIHDFDFGTDGGGPQYSTLTLDSAGNLYGTTQVGGTPKHGIAFKLAPPTGGVSSWTETILHSFTSTPDGAEPESGFVLSGGKLIGTTFQGGTKDQGTVYQLSR